MKEVISRLYVKPNNRYNLHKDMLNFLTVLQGQHEIDGMTGGTYILCIKYIMDKAGDNLTYEEVKVEEETFVRCVCFIQMS